MKNIKEMIINNKKLVIIGGGVLILILLLIIILANTNRNKEKEIDLEGELSKAGGKFYTDYYYVQIEDKNDLKLHKDNGINLTITNLEVLLPLDEETKKAFDEKKCDYDNTKLIIYPEEPYEINDYKVKVELSCEK